MKNKNDYTVDEMLASWEAVGTALSSGEATHIVPRRQLWGGYLVPRRYQQLMRLLWLMLVILMLVVLVVLAHYRVHDWLAMVPYVVAGLLLLYSFMSAVAGVVEHRRRVSYAVGAAPTAALWRLHPTRMVSLAAVLLLLLLVVTPTYAKERMRVSNAEMRDSAVGDVEYLLSRIQ